MFDFNGTLSDDEPILAEIYATLMAREGRPLTPADYAEHLAGNTDEAIFGRWLGLDERSERVAALTSERIATYCATVADGSTITAAARAAVQLAASRVPVAVASGAARAEILPALAGAGLADLLSDVVAADDVTHGKPHPETYRRALALLEARLGHALDPADVVAFEDTSAGIASAKAAGLRCVAVLGTLPRERLAQADEIVATLDPLAVARYLTGRAAAAAV